VSHGDQTAFPNLKPGEVLDGRFVMNYVIGAGGQGMVFQLRHMEWNRDFALKLPKPEAVQDDKSRELFLKEAEAWIRLGVHPHIVRCWFVRPIGDLPGLFLDFMSGGSLENKIQSKAIVPGQWDRVLQILIQVLEGLIHAHSKGMVHRDLKPENLMIDGDGRVCITDFGLVKLLGDSELPDSFAGPLPADSWLTAGAMGTPRYAAPEQWLNPASVNQTTDLYSLGVIMFELLCGQRPFDSPDERFKSTQIIQRHLGDAPPDLFSIRDDIPPELAELCLRLLSKSQSERPQSAEIVLSTLWKQLNSRGLGNHERPSPIPSGERPDFLNNAAVSLYSLGKTEKARELFLKGLMLEAGHPQCLFNLIQLERREGKLDREEAIRRLKRAKAVFGLALLYIEAAQGKKAAEVLSRIPEDEKSGLLHRLEGDALMYAGEFGSALSSYQKAALQMPNDLPTKLRKNLAENKTIQANGRVYFPPSGSSYQSRNQRPGVDISLSPDGEMILALDDSEVFGLSIQDNKILQQAKRGLYATPVLWSDAHRSILLIQDRRAFEIWSLNEFRMLSRIEGKVLARDHELRRLLALTEDGFLLFDRNRQQATPLALTPELQVSPPILAEFDYDESRLVLLTQVGRLFALGTSAQITPIHWPHSIEDPDKVGHMCWGQDLVAVSYRSTLLRCFCLQKKRIAAEQELGFLPTSLECDGSGSLILASSPKTHVILEKDGRTVTGGPGPVALDVSKERCLIWTDEHLHLYQLNPYQYLRTWEEAVPRPHVLRFSRDGRRAMSLDEDGECRVWEVDEESRVFERNMLMAPGQTYPEIIAGFGEYLSEFERALQLFKDKDFRESWKSLRRARKVAGFQQAEEALELQWALCAELQRDGLEAIWERLYISDTVSGQLSADCRHLLLAQEHTVELFEISGPRIESELKFDPGFRLFSAHFLRDGSESGLIICFGLDGELGYYSAENGELKYKDKLKTGRLSAVQFYLELALLQNSSGQAFTLELGTAKMSESLPLMERTLKRAFLLENKRALLVTYHGSLMTDLRKKKSSPGLPAQLEIQKEEISFCADPHRSKLRIIGLSNGTLIMTNQKGGRPLFTFEQENGAVSAAAINLETALGVSVSTEGGITFFDLSTGEVLERIVAHAEGVADLSITQDGRYVTTRSVGGHFRLWEVSWSLSNRLGSREIEWLRGSTLDKLGNLFRK
jgi:serine/threonine protein kinase